MKNASSTTAAAVTLAGVGLAVAIAASRSYPRPELSAPPATLEQTGLYADWSTRTVARDNLPFTPQYPLWSDGARKRRWIYLPAPIDATDPDAWQFPIGTRIWKEFSFAGRTETRFMLRARDGWHYATYVWSADEARADRAPAAGAPSVELAAGVSHHIPSEADCRACHGNGRTPVLGFSALQLSTDRDPRAPHRETPAPRSLDLAGLVATGRVRGITNTAPRIAGPPLQRAALGYLHGNCGGCHRAEGPLAALDMELAHSLKTDGEPAARTTIDKPSRFLAPASRVVPGDSSHSVLLARMSARRSTTQMPPLGTELVDAEATRLIADWIDQLAPTH